MSLQPIPLHTIYLQFYSALSNESLARSMNNLSTSKTPILEQSKASYETAAKILQSIQPNHESDAASESSSYDSDTISRPSTPNTSALESYSEGSHSPPSFDGAAGDFSPYRKDIIKPSPLRIWKGGSMVPTITPTGAPATESQAPLRKLRPLTFSPSKIPLAVPPSTITYPHSTMSSLFPATTCDHQTRSSSDRYMNSLLCFQILLRTHIQTVCALISTTTSAQTDRFIANNGLSSHGADEETRAEDRRGRIERGRVDGWRRERFRPGRYREFCEGVLGEL